MKPTLPTYFLRIRHGYLLVTQNFTFSAKIIGFVLFFLYSMLFLKLYGFFKNCNKPEIISGEILCFALNISVARVWRFFDVYWRYYL